MCDERGGNDGSSEVNNTWDGLATVLTVDKGKFDTRKHGIFSHNPLYLVGEKRE